MNTITVTRVNGRGEMTGEAELAVWEQGGGVYVKLGMLRVSMEPGRWEQLVRPTLGEPVRPAGEVKIRFWDYRLSQTEAVHVVTGWPGVPRTGDLLRLPWRAAARVLDVTWDFPAGAVDIYVS